MGALDDLEAIGRDYLRDYPQFFSQVITADGQDRYRRLDVGRVVETGLVVAAGGTPATFTLQARDGYIKLDTPPAEGVPIVVEGYHYLFVSKEELKRYMGYALDQFRQSEGEAGADQMLDKPDSKVAVAIAGLLEALWALLTEAARDIDVSAPEVSVPATQRFRQIQQLITYWEDQLSERTKMLNIGRSKIEVFTLRRVSRQTNRLVPVYKPQEWDDTAPAERVLLPIDDGVL